VKSGIHPDYRRVVFEDSSGRQRWICRAPSSPNVEPPGRAEPK
jgi:ribosomal protein L31